MYSRVAPAQRGVQAELNRKSEVMRIRLLGGFQVSVGTKRTVRENDWRRRKAAGIIKLLALAPGHRMHREQVMDLLWPQLGVEASANNLRRVLHVARWTLEPISEAASLYLCLQDNYLA